SYRPACSLTIHRPPRSRPFPYTTLFRSGAASATHSFAREPQRTGRRGRPARGGALRRCVVGAERPARCAVGVRPWPQVGHRRPRSEEHTSELQSRENLVCRLLLEKKKRK